MAMRTKSDKEAKLNLDQLKAPKCWRSLLIHGPCITGTPWSLICVVGCLNLPDDLWSTHHVNQDGGLCLASKTENCPAAKGSRRNVEVMRASISWSGGLLQRVRRHSGRAKESLEAEVRPVPSSRMSVPLETWRQLGPLKNANPHPPRDKRSSNLLYFIQYSCLYSSDWTSWRCYCIFRYF